MGSGLSGWQLVAVIIIAAFLSIALGKALDKAPVPEWVTWSFIVAITLVAVLILQGVVNL